MVHAAPAHNNNAYVTNAYIAHALLVICAHACGIYALCACARIAEFIGQN